ncbi:MAG: tyrosine-type recombinase/integrase [Phycisphaerae bacterium]
MNENNTAKSHAVLAIEPAEPPAIITSAGTNARFAYQEFFQAQIENPHTRRAYRRAVDRLLDWCHRRDVPLGQVGPWLIGEYLGSLTTGDGRPLAKPTRKLHLAALRHFFDHLVVRHAVALNPAASVRGPRHSVVEGRTPALSASQARQLLARIDIRSLIGIRDRAIIGVLIYTAVRAGAVVKLRRRDFFTDGRQWLFRFDEKGGKERVIPARHDLEGFVREFLTALGDASQAAPLFVSLRPERGGAAQSPLHTGDILRMIKRRLRRAGLPAETLSCHSFRATTITNLLEQGVPLEDVQQLAGHADPRTTRLYDRRRREVTRNIVERIAI